MAHWKVSIQAHLIEVLRPEGWPYMIDDTSVWDDKGDHATLAEFVNQKCRSVVTNGGIYVSIPEYENSKERKNGPPFGDGVFVPLHMISHVGYDIRRVVMPKEGVIQ